jgi:hypothetical protein
MKSPILLFFLITHFLITHCAPAHGNIQYIPDDIPESSTIATTIEQDYGFTANQFTNFVYRRFYFINRLEKIMNSFSRINKTITKTITTKTSPGPRDRHLNIDRIFNLDIAESFSHPMIKNSLNTIKTKRSLRPLFTVWDSFKSYKLIEDQLLIEEFTKEIFVISRNLILSSLDADDTQEQGTNFTRDHDIHPMLSLCSCCLLDMIDIYLDQFLQIQTAHKHTGNIDDPQKNINSVHDLKPFIHMDDIVERFYHLQRLQRPMAHLYFLYKGGYPYRLNRSIQIKNSTIIIDNYTQFTHPDIVSCIKVMQQTQSWLPLIQLLCEVKRYKFIQDQGFMHELSCLLFVISHTIVAHETHKQNPQQKNITLEQVAELYEKIDSLPIENILDAIDLLSEQIPVLLEKYAFDPDTKTWCAWFKKHWWHASVDMVKLTLKVLLKLKPSHLVNALMGRESAAQHHEPEDIDQIFRLNSPCYEIG